MSRQIRKRETRAGKEREAEKEDTQPITTEEQEKIIQEFRAKAESNKKVGRQVLDVLVIIGMFMCTRQAVRYTEASAPLLLIVLTVLQTLLLIFSLSPGWTPIAFFNNVANQRHQQITAFQLVLFMAIFFNFRKSTAIPPPTIIDVLRWALPELIAGAVEWQRGSERDSERNLANLEQLKYNLKGA